MSVGFSSQRNRRGGAVLVPTFMSIPLSTLGPAQRHCFLWHLECC